MKDIRLFNGDCINIMQDLIDDGIEVDMSFADLPYGETGNKWDKPIDHTKMFNLLEQLVSDEGAMVFTGSFKHGVNLYNARKDLYKYDWVWVKENGTNIPSVNYQPFRVHEQIFIYGKGRVSNGKRTPMKYNPQKTKAKPYKATMGSESTNYRALRKTTTINKGDRHPKSVQFFKRDKNKVHPTQKPVKMLEYLIKTYTDEGDTVIDFCMGSGSTGVACKNLSRNFIGIELDNDYFNIAKERINDAQTKLL